VLSRSTSTIMSHLPQKSNGTCVVSAESSVNLKPMLPQKMFLRRKLRRHRIFRPKEHWTPHLSGRGRGRSRSWQGIRRGLRGCCRHLPWEAKGGVVYGGMGDHVLDGETGRVDLPTRCAGCRSFPPGVIDADVEVEGHVISFPNRTIRPQHAGFLPAPTLRKRSSQ
jgi:hypothetical protein